ncbi:hypothetical protein [Parafilimonas sp.]|uniref:hypothetical protein n=1 Tax=Parafilimonas sp. TaxID=1969739 RepID=UPI003F823FB8
MDTRMLSGLQRQYSRIQSKVNKQTTRLLSKMHRQEEALQKQLSATDSIKAKELFNEDIEQRYKDLQANLKSKTDELKQFPLTEYLPGVDSIQTSLNFLAKSVNLPDDKIQQVQAVSEKLKSLQTELQKANDIKSFIKERESQLKEQLLNSGLAKQLKGINKNVYYYQQQLSEYKELLNDKQKLKQKLLETVRTLPAFQKFWERNSYFTALFPTPSNAGTPEALTGLQTRASVQSAVAQRIGSGTNVNPQQYIQGQVDATQAQISQLKDKLNKFSNGGSSDMAMPDFSPNSEKSKSFLKRLEYGMNIQSEKGRYSLPAMSDIALTLGYKLSDNKRMGIGASYKVGWGDIKHIHVTSEGVGLRSYVDIKMPTVAKGKILGGIWFSGGFEYNYLSSFKTIQELHRNVDVWQRSALLGLSKKYRIGKKEGNMQLLYDFLHNRQTPPGTALKFRIGYCF